MATSRSVTYQKHIGEYVYEFTTYRLIMTADLNAAGRLFGGKLVAWVDEAVALYCMTKMGTRKIVTKKISELVFNEPANLADIIQFYVRIIKIGTTSMTTECIVLSKAIDATEKEREIVRCEVVFVAIDDNGRPIAHGLN